MALALSGCAMRPPIEPFVACRIVKDNRFLVENGGPRDLYELSYGTPVHGAARNAWAQQITTYTLTVMGGAALAAGLVTAFATDPATQPGARDAGYATAGGAIGMGVIALILGNTLPVTLRRTREALRSFGDRCRAEP